MTAASPDAARFGWWQGTDVPLAVWSAGPPTAGHVAVVLPPVSYGYSSASRLLTALLEALADQGLEALLLDHRGVGDSFGALSTQQQALDDVEALVAALVAEGAVVTVLGVEWGGTLAQATRAPGVVSAVAVAPAAGRRWVRQLQLLGERDEATGTLAVGGYTLPPGFLDDAASAPAPEDPPHPLLRVVPGEQDERLGTTWTSPGLRKALENPAEEAEVDAALVRAVAEWVSASVTEPRAPRATALPVVTTVEVAGVREQAVVVGDPALPGWRTGPVGGDSLLVLLNSGGDPHTGPGRAWVDLARELAERGGPAVLRFDARGWGRTGATWGCGRPYDTSMVEDVERVLETLRPSVRRLAVGGLCAGAWIAMDVARRLDVDDVLAVNVQLYWERGDPVEARIADTIIRREPEAQQLAREAHEGRWDREDASGLRNPAGQWLDELAARPVRTALVFSGDDPGLRYLRDRLAARLADVQERGGVEVVRLPDLDHGLQRSWLRSQLADAVLSLLGPSTPEG